MRLKSLLKGKNYFYLMHLSYGYQGSRKYKNRRKLWNYARKNNIIGLSHSKVEGNWNMVKTVKPLSGIWNKQFEIFYNNMKKNDIVVIMAGWESILGVAKIPIINYKAKYNLKLKEEGEFFEHIRKVCWIRAYEFDAPLSLKELVYFDNTLKKVEQDNELFTILGNIKLK